jgi:hypothetical protein
MESNDTPIFERAKDYIEFYANHAQAGFTGFDIFVFLSEVAPENDGRTHVRQKARITMSPIEALLLSRFLKNAVEQHEETFGLKVVIPPTIDSREVKYEG